MVNRSALLRVVEAASVDCAVRPEGKTANN